MDTEILENKHILLVEDDRVNQMLFERSIIKLNTKVTIAGDGEKAIELLQKENFDLVIMDIYLPGMDGCETTQIIRKQLQSDIPIIAITASPIDEEIQRCFRAGMNGHMRKPFTVEQLVEAASKVIPQKQVEEEEDSSLIGDDMITIDLSFLKTIADDDEEYIHMIIKTFNENMPPVIEKMNRYYKDGDRDNLSKTAHYAKSSLSVIQIKQMFSQALNIETDAKKAKLPDEKMNIAIQDFSKQFDRAKDILNNYVSSHLHKTA